MAETRFQVVYVSSSNEKLYAEDVSDNLVDGRGWVSSKNCDYPQQLLIELERSVEIQNLNIVPNRFFVPARVDVYIGKPPGDSEKLSYDVFPDDLYLTSIGNVKFPKSPVSGAAETMYPETNGSVILLNLYENHKSPDNKYNQVGIKSISFNDRKYAAKPKTTEFTESRRTNPETLNTKRKSIAFNKDSMDNEHESHRGAQMDRREIPRIASTAKGQEIPVISKNFALRMSMTSPVDKKRNRKFEKSASHHEDNCSCSPDDKASHSRSDSPVDKDFLSICHRCGKPEVARKHSSNTNGNRGRSAARGKRKEDKRRTSSAGNPYIARYRTGSGYQPTVVNSRNRQRRRSRSDSRDTDRS